MYVVQDWIILIFINTTRIVFSSYNELINLKFAFIVILHI